MSVNITISDNVGGLSSGTKVKAPKNGHAREFFPTSLNTYLSTAIVDRENGYILYHMASEPRNMVGGNLWVFDYKNEMRMIGKIALISVNHGTPFAIRDGKLYTILQGYRTTTPFQGYYSMYSHDLDYNRMELSNSQTLMSTVNAPAPASNLVKTAPHGFAYSPESDKLYVYWGNESGMHYKPSIANSYCRATIVRNATERDGAFDADFANRQVDAPCESFGVTQTYSSRHNIWAGNSIGVTNSANIGIIGGSHNGTSLLARFDFENEVILPAYEAVKRTSSREGAVGVDIDSEHMIQLEANSKSIYFHRKNGAEYDVRGFHEIMPYATYFGPNWFYTYANGLENKVLPVIGKFGVGLPLYPTSNYNGGFTFFLCSDEKMEVTDFSFPALYAGSTTAEGSSQYTGCLMASLDFSDGKSTIESKEGETIGSRKVNKKYSEGGMAYLQALTYHYGGTYQLLRPGRIAFNAK